MKKKVNNLPPEVINLKGKEDNTLPKSLRLSREEMLLASMHIYNWFVDHQEKLFIEEYFTDTDTWKPVCRDAFLRWRHLNDDLKNVYESLKDLLLMRLVKRGLTRTYDANMVKFCIINNHKWKDKVTQEVDMNEVVKFEFGGQIEEENDEDVK